MQFSPLQIGELTARIPVIQGGMGVGVSASGLAAAVAREGGIGVIASVQLGYDEPDFEKNLAEANLRALKKHIRLAKENAPGGIVGVNIMVAVNHYDDSVKAAIEAGADLIISGAGLPMGLPKLTKGSSIKIAPIVSSLKSAKVILKLWDKHDGRAPDLVVVEGPKAGGHLGFSLEECENPASVDFDKTVSDIVEEVAKYEEKYGRKIPVVAAGGVFTGEDIAHYMKLGASGVQMATRFVATEECDASPAFKQAYLDAGENDVMIVKSPVGMPGRAVRNAFVEHTLTTRDKIGRCYNCLITCNPAETPYCISRALINAVTGDVEHGLVFCGANAGRVTQITTVKALMEELVSELEKA